MFIRFPFGNVSFLSHPSIKNTICSHCYSLLLLPFLPIPSSSQSNFLFPSPTPPILSSLLPPLSRSLQLLSSSDPHLQRRCSYCSRIKRIGTKQNLSTSAPGRKRKLHLTGEIIPGPVLIKERKRTEEHKKDTKTT